MFRLARSVHVTYSTLATALVVGALSLPTAFATGRNPVGETAHYDVDRSSSRTSAMVQGGSLDSAITEALPNDPNGSMYRLAIDWELRIRLAGTQRGTRQVKVPEAYFTPQFMRDLRANGEYAGPTFRVRHMGYGDARNMDGAFYPNCDKILVYDIAEEADNALIDVARELLVTAAGDGDQTLGNDIEDMEILGHVKEGVPVLGAVKMDVTGKYQGQRIKVGADYKLP